MSSLNTKLNLKKCADETFDRLGDLWIEGLNDDDGTDWLRWDFWKAGNTLDAYVDYLIASGKTDEKGFISRSYNDVYYPKRNYKTSGKWRDDYGWWGNAFVNVVKNAVALGLDDTSQKKYLEAAKNCWQCLGDNASDNWNFGMGNPTVPSNIGASWCAWNNDGAEKYWNTPNRETSFQPTPNTVTNLGYLSLSFGLKNILKPNDPDYKKYNVAALNGIRDWLSMLSNESSKDDENMLFNEVWLVRETPNPWVHRNWCFDLTRGWSADQGVMMHVLLEGINSGDSATIAASEKMLLKLFQGFDTNEDNTTKNTLIIDCEFKEYKTKEVPDTKDSNLSNFNDNYCTGPGVFMRYVSNAYPRLNFDNNHEFVKKLILKTVVASATKAWENRDDGTQQMLYWYGPIEDSPYYKYFSNADSKQKHIWPFAFQTAALDLFVALLKLTP